MEVISYESVLFVCYFGGFPPILSFAHLTFYLERPLRRQRLEGGEGGYGSDNYVSTGTTPTNWRGWLRVA